MRIEHEMCGPVFGPFRRDCTTHIEIEDTPFRIVEVNEDGSYKVLFFTGNDYILVTRARFIGIDAFADDDGVVYKRISKEDWDSWGRDFPRNYPSVKKNEVAP